MRTSFDAPMINQAELKIAAVIGALLGIVTGYLLGHGWVRTIIWALIGAVVVSGWFIVCGLFVNECPLAASRRFGQSTILQ